MKWHDRMYANPFGTMVALAAVILGVLGGVIGDQISQGMSNSLAGSANVVAHIWGVAFCVGGLLKLIGLGGHRTELEIPGLWLLSGGYAFYSLTVMTGLGHGGIAAGTISGCLAIGCLARVRIIMRTAHAASSPGGTQR